MALLTRLFEEIQQTLVVFNLPKLLKKIIITIQKIDNRFCALGFYISYNQTPSHISQNLGIQEKFWPKSIQSVSSLVEDFFHSYSVTLATIPSARGGKHMNLGVGRARGPLTLIKCLYQMKNNLCMYYRGANHYAGNRPRTANRKTLLCKIVVNKKNVLPSLLNWQHLWSCYHLPVWKTGSFCR